MMVAGQLRNKWRRTCLRSVGGALVFAGVAAIISLTTVRETPMQQIVPFVVPAIGIAVFLIKAWEAFGNWWYYREVAKHETARPGQWGVP